MLYVYVEMYIMCVWVVWWRWFTSYHFADAGPGSALIGSSILWATTAHYSYNFATQAAEVTAKWHLI